jgi:hypothetical protein
MTTSTRIHTWCLKWSIVKYFNCGKKEEKCSHFSLPQYPLSTFHNTVSCVCVCVCMFCFFKICSYGLIPNSVDLSAVRPMLLWNEDLEIHQSQDCRKINKITDISFVLMCFHVISLMFPPLMNLCSFTQSLQPLFKAVSHRPNLYQFIIHYYPFSGIYNPCRQLIKIDDQFIIHDQPFLGTLASLQSAY